MRKRFRWPVVLPGLLLLLGLSTGCIKDPLNNLSNEESRIYITNFDSTASFSSFKTFRIADSVAVITNSSADRSLTTADQSYIAAVRKYMTARGYREVGQDSVPDLGINVNRIYSTSTGVISYADYWGYYGGYWDPYYWGYSGYGYYVPYSYAVYEITEGAYSVDLLDLKDAAGKNTINIIWTGLVRGTDIMNPAVADTQVKALFDQSEYLRAGNN